MMSEDINIKNIWVCGVGGVGGYFGGRIAHRIDQMNRDDLKVFFLARGSHLEQIKQNGLELIKEDGEKILCRPRLASNKVQDLYDPDLCLLCVKSYDLEDLIDSIKPKLGDSTIIIPLMNGIDIYERIRKILKKGIVLPACVYVGSHIETPGLVVQSGNPGFFYCGPDPNYPDFNPKPTLDFFEKMNIEMYWQENPYPAIWEKYVLVASFALVTAHTGQTLGGVINDENSLEMLKKIMKEIVQIANKKGIELPENIIEKIIDLCRNYPEVKTSYQRDVEKGKQNEGDIFGGAIIRMGNELGIPTPMTTSIYKESA